jgi:hypothetical protein
METIRNTKEAVCVYHINAKTQRKIIRYKSLYDLVEKVFEFETSFQYAFNIFMVHDVCNNVCLDWNSTFAHYCFGKGRISVDEFLNHISRKKAIN